MNFVSARFYLNQDYTLSSENNTIVPFDFEYYSNENFILNSDGSITCNLSGYAMLCVSASLYFVDGTINNLKGVQICRIRDGQSVIFGKNVQYIQMGYQCITCNNVLMGVKKGDVISCTFGGKSNDIIGRDINATNLSIIALPYSVS